jgi:hypothetical protein
VTAMDAAVAEGLEQRYGRFEASLLSAPGKIEDGIKVLLIRDSARQPRAVILVSSPAAPNMVERAMRRARLAKSILGNFGGAHILDPVTEGKTDGLTYAVLPYCRPLSDSRPVWWIQRAFLLPSLLAWLRRATECTARELNPDSVDQRFGEPLRRLATLQLLGARMRAAASRALERLEADAWTPRFVLMHGDFWKGNVLTRPASASVERRAWQEGFVIIDWAGSEVEGYAIYDLVRLSESMRVHPRRIREEVEKHCRLLSCVPADARSYLLAALGHIALHLEHFPLFRYVQMAESSFATLERALG